MTPYIRRGRKYFEMRVPLTRGRGDGPIRSLETSDPGEKDEIVALLARLRKKTEYWPLIDAVTASPPRLSLMDLLLADRKNQLDQLIERLDDADLVVYLDGWEKWVRSNLGDTGTAEMYLSQVGTLIAPDGDDSPPFLTSDLTPAKVGTWLAKKDVTTGYRRKLLYALFSFIGYLKEFGVLEGNPIESIKRPKKGKARIRWETEANDIRIVRAAPKEYQSLYAFIKATGAEVSAALALTARDLEIWPDDDGTRYCGQAHVPGTKTETRDRHDVLIEKWARPFLTIHALPNAKLWPDTSRYQAHWHHENACVAAQIPDYTLRDARHSWAVRARKNRPQVSFEAIAAQLGNTVATVAKVYAAFKMSPEEMRSEGSAVATEPATQSETEAKILPIREAVSQ